jgi:cell division protein FtsB
MPPRAVTPASGSPRLLPSGGRRSLRGSLPSASGTERRTLGAIVGILVTIWLVAVFGSALADSNALNARQTREEATNAALRAQVAAGRAEIAYIQTDPFLQFEARSFGMGMPRERAFALEPGAPDPRPITPLGSSDEPPIATTPLEDWLKLLFGG